MRTDSTRDLLKMGRRNFIKTLAGLGVSREALQGITKEKLYELTDNPRKMVPVASYHEHTNHEQVINGEEPPKRKTTLTLIPRDEWALTQAAHNAAQRIHTKIKRKMGIDKGVNVGVRTLSRNTEVKIVVTYRRVVDNDKNILSRPSIEFERLAKQLPDKITSVAGKDRNKMEVEDIPVIVEEEEIPHHNHHYNHHYEIGGSEEIGTMDHSGDPDHFDSKYRGVPGGCHIKTERHKSDACDYCSCTSCTPAYDTSVNKYGLVTAGHCFEGDGDEQGKKAWQPRRSFWSDNQIGVCFKSDYDASGLGQFDAAFMDFRNGASFRYGLAEENGGIFASIWGTVAWDKIKHRDITHLNLQGASAGRNLLKIITTYPEHRTIQFSGDLTYGGDSGGPYYDHDDYGNVKIAGVLNKGFKSISEGTYIGTVEKRLGILV